MTKKTIMFLLLALSLMACESGTTKMPLDQGSDFDDKTSDYGVEGDDGSTTETEGAVSDTGDSLLPTDADVPEGQSDILTDDDILPDETNDGNDLAPDDDGTLPEDTDIVPDDGSITGDDGTITQDDGIAFDLDIQPDEVVITEIAKRWASDYSQVGYLGYSVALHGDLAIAGAIYSDIQGTNSGSAHIFERNYGGPNNWGERKVLLSANGADDENFGWDVAINSDHAFVLKVRDQLDAKNGPAIYYYRKDQGGAANWGYVKKQVLNGGGVNFNRRGVALLATDEMLFIGGPCNDAVNTPPGCVFIHSRNLGGTNNWGLLKEIRSDESMGGDRFGATLALDGDRLAVGATYMPQDMTIAMAGAVYVFERNEGGANNWGQVAKIIRPETSEKEDYFGSAVAVSGDYLMVGFPNDDYWGENAGAVYVFYRNEGGDNAWGSVQKIIPDEHPQLAVAGEFGKSIATKGPILFAGAHKCGDILYQDFYYPGAVFGYFNSMAEEDPLEPLVRARFDYSKEPDTTSGFGFDLAVDGNTLMVGFLRGGDLEMPTGIQPGEVVFYNIEY